MAFDIFALENKARQEVETQITERVLASLASAKDAAHARLEEAKSDLNAIDAEIANRTPQVEAPVEG